MPYWAGFGHLSDVSVTWTPAVGGWCLAAGRKAMVEFQNGNLVAPACPEERGYPAGCFSLSRARRPGNCRGVPSGRPGTKSTRRRRLFVWNSQNGIAQTVQAVLTSRRKDSTSTWVGIDGCAPCRVTEMAATAEANLTLAIGSLPRRRAVAKAPLNASPAAVVSTALTL
jgi:hypothetical protein